MCVNTFHIEKVYNRKVESSTSAWLKKASLTVLTEKFCKWNSTFSAVLYRQLKILYHFFIMFKLNDIQVVNPSAINLVTCFVQEVDPRSHSRRRNETVNNGETKWWQNCRSIEWKSGDNFLNNQIHKYLN